MWSHAPGSRDSYFLSISHGNFFILSNHQLQLQGLMSSCIIDNVTMDTREVEPNMRECTFNVLTPGTLYTITVTTRSGRLNTSVSLEGRTGV